MDLVGKKVRLRAQVESDADFFAATLADPEVVQYLASWAWVPYGTREAREYLSTKPTGSVGWTIECLDDGQPIGATGLHNIDHRNRNCTWGIWTGPPERWNRGFGTEACKLAVGYAFNQLAMEKVSLDVYEGNERARKSYAKAGFAREGILRRHIWLGGRLVDIEVMAVFRDHPLYTRQSDSGTA